MLSEKDFQYACSLLDEMHQRTVGQIETLCSPEEIDAINQHEKSSEFTRNIIYYKKEKLLRLAFTCVNM